MDIVITLICIILLSILVEVLLHIGEVVYQFRKTGDVTVIVNGSYLRIRSES